MSICYHEGSREFHLSNRDISYIITVLKNGQLGQLYFGKKLHDRESFAHLLELRHRPMAVCTYEGDSTFSMEHIKQEYPSYGEWQVLNSKDFGVPQNRERCFIVGHLRGRSTAKVFPIEGTDGENSVSLNLFGCLNGRNSQRDRVYSDNGLAPTISTKPGGNTEPKVSILFDTSYIGQDGKARIYENICPTLTSRDYKEPRSVGVVCNVNPSGKGMNGKVYDSTGLSPTLTTNKGEGNKIVIPVLTPDRIEKRQNGRRFKENGEPMFTLTSQDRHGVAIDPLGVLRNVRTEYGKEVANTLDTSCNQGIFVQVSEELTVYAVWYEKYQCYIAIRKLTPKECFRLQGWSDDYFEKAQFVNSDSQLYKQAGNGVTVTVIETIARKMNVNSN